jgi:hypothetical protein
MIIFSMFALLFPVMCYALHQYYQMYVYMNPEMREKYLLQQKFLHIEVQLCLCMPEGVLGREDIAAHNAVLNIMKLT